MLDPYRDGYAPHAGVMRITNTVKQDIRIKGRFFRGAAAMMLAAVAAGALAQTVPDQTVPETGGLDIPSIFNCSESWTPMSASRPRSSTTQS